MFITASLPVPIPEQHPPVLSAPTQHSVLELGMSRLPVFVKICFSNNTESSHWPRAVGREAMQL